MDDAPLSPDRPRIAYVTSSRGIGGGAERLLAALLNVGAERGWDQLVLNPFATETSVAIAELCPTARYAGRGCERRRELPALRRWLQSEIDEFRPDIVHVMLLQALLVFSTARKRDGQSWLLTHVYGDVFGVRRFGGAYRVLDRWAGRRFDRIVAISDAVEAFLVQTQRYSPENVVCISPGWEGDPLPRRDSGPPTVVCVAKMRPEKGHDVLIDAFALVCKEVPEARLVLVGDGPLQPALEARAESLGVRSRLTFAGAVPEIWPYLADASVFALASRSEAFGIAVVEAMAAGLPVVAPAVGALPELVTPGVSGELYAAGDHAALARHLVDILTSPTRRRQMGDAAAKIAEGFHIDVTVDQYMHLYDELLEPRRRAGPRSARSS